MFGRDDEGFAVVAGEKGVGWGVVEEGFLVGVEAQERAEREFGLVEIDLVILQVLDGAVDVKVPAGSQAGQRLRLRGQGLNRRRGERGDAFVRLKVVVPTSPTDEERRLYEQLRAASRTDPRATER